MFAVSGDGQQHARAEAAFGEAGRPRGRPSVAGYWIGGAVCVAAVAGAILWLVTGLVGFANAVDDLQRVPVPGGGVLELGSGRHAIYYESSAGENARVPPLRIALRPVGGGSAVAVGGHSGSVTYSISGHSGRSLAGFAIARPGRYRLTVAETSAPSSGAVLAVGRGLGGRLVRAIVGAIVVFLGGTMLGGAMVVFTSTRRSRAASRAASAPG